MDNPKYQKQSAHEKRVGYLPCFEQKRIPTPLQAIRRECLDCCCGKSGEVKDCTLTTCTLWPYRLGKRPKE